MTKSMAPASRCCRSSSQLNASAAVALAQRPSNRVLALKLSSSRPSARSSRRTKPARAFPSVSSSADPFSSSAAILSAAPTSSVLGPNLAATGLRAKSDETRSPTAADISTSGGSSTSARFSSAYRPDCDRISPNRPVVSTVSSAFSLPECHGRSMLARSCGERLPMKVWFGA